MAQTVPAAPNGASRWPVGRLLAGAVVVLLAVLFLLPDLLGLDRWVPFAALLALRPQLTMATLLMALLALLGRPGRRPEAVAVLLVGLAAAVLVAPRAVTHGPPPSGGQELTVLAFNVDRGQADVPTLAATIRRDRPDVVVLPEAAQRYRTLLGDAIPDLGYRSTFGARPGAEDVNGITVFTAPGLGPVSSRMIDQGGFDPWLELTGGRLGALRLVAVHISAPVPGKIASWTSELAQLQAWCAAGAGPALIVGDFNATLDHREFRDGMRGCQDTAATTGQGLTATWNAAWPRWWGAQIDHVLSAGRPQPASLRILDLPGSDHRALLARLRLPPG